MAIMAAQKVAEASPTAMEAGLPPGRDGEMWMAIMAAQEAAEASPMAVEAGLPTGRGGETCMAIMAAQETAEVSLTAAEAGLPLEEMKRRRWQSWPLWRRLRCPQRRRRLGFPPEKMEIM